MIGLTDGGVDDGEGSLEVVYSDGSIGGMLPAEFSEQFADIFILC